MATNHILELATEALHKRIHDAVVADLEERLVAEFRANIKPIVADTVKQRLTFEVQKMKDVGRMRDELHVFVHTKEAPK